MNPRQVDELEPREWEAMIRYVIRDQREQRRAERAAQRKRR